MVEAADGRVGPLTPHDGSNGRDEIDGVSLKGRNFLIALIRSSPSNYMCTWPEAAAAASSLGRTLGTGVPAGKEPYSAREIFLR